MAARHVQRARFIQMKIKVLLSFGFFPPVPFDCLCQLQHPTPFEGSAPRVLQAGPWHGAITDPWHCRACSLSIPLPVLFLLLQELVRAGGGSGVHVLRVVFVGGHGLPPLNAFPLHSSVLKPYFDLGDGKEMINYDLRLSCLSRPMHTYQQRCFVKFWKKNGKEPHKLKCSPSNEGNNSSF